MVESDIKVDVPEVPESPMPPTSVDDRDDILGLIFYITTPKYSITSLATSAVRFRDFFGSIGRACRAQENPSVKKENPERPPISIAAFQVFLCSSR